MATAEAVQGQGGRTIPWWLVLLEGIAAVIIGILLLAEPRMTITVLVWIMGIYWFVAGIFSIISIFIDSSAWGWKLFIGILGILAGLVIMRHPLWSSLLVPTVAVIVLGIQGLIMGIVRLIQAFQGEGWGAGVLGVLSILFGIVLLANPIIAGLTLPWVLGIFGIVGGIFAIIAAFRLK